MRACVQHGNVRLQFFNLSAQASLATAAVAAVPPLAAAAAAHVNHSATVKAKEEKRNSMPHSRRRRYAHFPFFSSMDRCCINSAEVSERNAAAATTDTPLIGIE